MGITDKDVLKTVAMDVPKLKIQMEDITTEVSDKVNKLEPRLETTSKDVIEAINEINNKTGYGEDERIGDLKNLQTAYKNDIVGAINEVKHLNSNINNEIVQKNQPFNDEKASNYIIEIPLNSSYFKNYNENTYGKLRASVTNTLITINGVVNKLTNGYVGEEPVIANLQAELSPDIIPVSNSISHASDWKSSSPQCVMVGNIGQLYIDSDVYLASGFKNTFLNVNLSYIINKTSIPEYIKNGAEAKINTFNSLEGSKIVLGTDLHCNPQKRLGFNNKNIYYPRIINYLGERVNSFANFVLGDIIDDSDSLTQIEGLNRLISMKRLFSYKTLCVRGNHDGNSIRGDSTPDKYIYADLYKREILDGKNNVNLNKGKAYYYVDNYDDGIRYICLDGCDCPNGKNPSYTYVISQEQLNWLIETLQKVPYGYHVALFMHQSLLTATDIPDMYDLYVNNASLAKGIVEAYNNKTTFVGNTTGEYSASVNVDFTNKTTTNNKIIGFFFGHYHYDYKKQINGIWHIGLDSVYTENPYSITSPNATDNQRSNGNITEIVFDLVNINKISSTVNMLRVGAGADRSFIY